jgi:hypothetical protein
MWRMGKQEFRIFYWWRTPDKFSCSATVERVCRDVCDAGGKVPLAIVEHVF